ncbi:acyltransferase family protein [Oceanicella sp. SM1341]|uniref:acyltransferase family protein n=1 Tax=Oceanicella sp. SM1341 TaxID=1548889 RepID=UPI0013006A2F|nr:acyltransferase family protein [Oceanicella sp. SM1341]
MHHIDWMRAFLMALGVPYHAALIYSHGTEWFIHSEEKSALLTYFASLTNSFRMPAFFIISGMLAAITIGTGSTRDWTLSRLTRLLVPLAVATLLISPLVMLAHQVFLAGGGAEGDILPGLLAEMALIDQNWVGHLWFLYALAFYFLIAAGLHALRDTRAIRRLRGGEGGRQISLYALCVIIVIYTLAVRTGTFGVERLTGFDFRLFGIMNLEAWALFLPYFLVGFAFRSLTFAEPGNGRYIIMALMAVGCASAFNQPDELNKLLWYSTSAVLSVLVSHELMRLFRRYCTAENRAVSRMSRASYTIYLFHMPVVCLLGAWFTTVDAPVFAEFLALCAVGIAAPVLFHELISRSRLALFLFNGAPLRRRGRAAPPRLLPAQGRAAGLRAVLSPGAD